MRRVVSVLAIAALGLLSARWSIAQTEGSVPRGADPPCFDNVNRYIDCANGTVTDSLTGLVWLRDASCLGRVDWARGNTLAQDLSAGQCGLTDGSVAGNWRLPTLPEWRATIARAVDLGCTTPGDEAPPTLTNDPGTACFADGPSSFDGVESRRFWTGSTNERFPNNAWVVSLEETVHGHVYTAFKTFELPVWPVRGPGLVPSP